MIWDSFPDQTPAALIRISWSSLEYLNFFIFNIFQSEYIAQTLP